MSKYLIDVMEVLTKDDGNFNDDIEAYVNVYPISEEVLAVELEYVDQDNDNEVVEVKRFTVRIEEN